MVKYYSRFEWHLVPQFGNRKGPGLICFFYDVNEKKFIPVPRDIEHVQFAAKLMSCDVDDIRHHFVDVSHLIPVTIILNPMDEIIEMITGISGLEIGFRVRHEKKDLRRAYRKALVFIKHGEVPISKNFKHKVMYKYAAELSNA